jgi:hypothetical protein
VPSFPIGLPTATVLVLFLLYPDHFFLCSVYSSTLKMEVACYSKKVCTYLPNSHPRRQQSSTTAMRTSNLTRSWFNLSNGFLPSPCSGNTQFNPCLG